MENSRVASSAERYVPLRVDEVLPRIQLRNSNGHSFGMPPLRLNLMVCKDDVLYFVGPDDSSSVIAYGIVRGGSAPLSLCVLEEYALLEQYLHANNAILFESSNGSTYLLVTGGSPAEQGANGTLAVFRIPAAGKKSGGLSGKLLRLPLKSAWGIDVAGDGSDMIALSSNSLVVSVFRLICREDGEGGNLQPALETLHHLRGHMGNIPCVSFGPGTEDDAKQLLYSASIDSSFGAFDFKRGQRLFQDSQSHEYYVQGVIVKDACWSVSALSTPLGSGAVKPVADGDALWSSLEASNVRKRGWLDEKRLALNLSAMESASVRQRLNATKLAVSNSAETGSAGLGGAPLPMYDDCCEREEEYSKSVGLRSGYCNEPKIASHRVCASWEPSDMEERPHVILEAPGGEEEGRLVVVGRESTIHLYRLTRRPGTRCRSGQNQIVAEEMQSLLPSVPPDVPLDEVDATLSRISHLIQLPSLSALLVVQQGGGVSIVRLVSQVLSEPHCSPPSHNPDRLCQVFMILERQLDMLWHPIVGVCVNERKDGCGRMDVCYEVFIAQAKWNERATIRAFELSRVSERLPLATI